MIRMTKQADYGIVLMAYFARDGRRAFQNARDLAEAARLPQPTVTKVLKVLAREGLLHSQRGVNGGYGLAREPEQISLAEIITALEGPIAITQCSDQGTGCDKRVGCMVGANWALIDRAVRDALDGITLRDMARPFPEGRVPQSEDDGAAVGAELAVASDGGRP